MSLNDWIPKLARGQYPTFPILVAASVILAYDRLDKVLMTRDSIPETKQSLQNLIKELN